MATPLILMETKDRMEFNLYHPVALGLEKSGCEVVVVAEGLSMDLWVNSGRAIYKGLPKEGDFDPNKKTRTDIDDYETLRHFKPKIVLTGLASPINLGEEFGVTANELGIKLGYIEDLWGVHRRSRALPDFICTLDAYGEKLILQHDGYKERPLVGDVHSYEYYDHRPGVFITGSPADDALRLVQPDPKTERYLEHADANFNMTRVILIGGQGKATTPMLAGLIEALEKSVDDNFVLIPRFHPKWMEDPSKAVYKDEWLRLLAPLDKKNRVLWTDKSVNTQSLVRSATEVVSIYSNLLREAVLLGSIAVSWTSDIGRTEMKADLSIEHFPLVEFGAAIEVSSPGEYFVKVPAVCSSEHLAIERRATEAMQADGKATERVVNAILSHL